MHGEFGNDVESREGITGEPELVIGEFSPVFHASGIEAESHLTTRDLGGGASRREQQEDGNGEWKNMLPCHGNLSKR